MSAAHQSATAEVVVIIATRGRPALLRQALLALAEQDLGRERYGVQVTVDGPDPDSVAVIEELRPRFAQLDCYVAPVQRGPAAARNLALQATDSTLVAITDDDCVPSPQWLSALAAAFVPGIGVVIGRTTTDRSSITPFSHFVENLDGRTHQTCNIAYRREVLEALGGFDERFPFSHEDTDLFCRAERITGVAFAPEAEVVHPPRKLTVRELARTARKFEGEFIFYDKDPELFRTRHSGHGPLYAVAWEVGVKHVLKQVVSEAPWLFRSPLMYMRYLLGMAGFAAILWSRLPRQALAHRGRRTAQKAEVAG